MFNLLDVLLTSLSMSIDACTVGAVDGVTIKDLKKREAFFIALMFGIFQAVMPLIGYSIGTSFKDQVEAYIPYIAFSLLLILSIKSFIDWFKEIRRKECEAKDTKSFKITTILVQAVATSIDALCIGFVYLNYTWPEALLTFGIIGLVTLLLSLITIFLGHLVSNKLERWGGLIAAIVFLAIGLKILLEGIL